MRVLVVHASKHGATAVVLGSAVYLGHWLKEARDYAQRHQAALATGPVWLFSSGPLGAGRVDDEGHDMREAAVPNELPELVGPVHPQEHHVFFGALDPKRLNLAQRALRKLPAGRELLPEGDFRAWPEVDQWATQISTHLQDTEPSP